MPIDYPALGKRIAFFRNQSHLTQEDFAYEVHLSRQYISQLETAACHPSLETIVEIANTLGVSTDDLLVDSLTHSVSTADTEVHRLLIDCNKLEAEILTRTLKELRAILYKNCPHKPPLHLLFQRVLLWSMQAVCNQGLPFS